MCHLLLVLPLVSLGLFFFMPFEQALSLYILILLLCSILYWLIWRAIRRPVTTGIEGMIGGTAQVIQNGRGTAKVFFRGEIWDAICRDDLSPGASVEVTGWERLERMKLIVQNKTRPQKQDDSHSRGKCH